MGFKDWVQRQFGEEPPPAPLSLPEPPGEKDILASLATVATMLEQGHASSLIRARVARVDRLLRAILPRLPRLGLGSADAYAVVATATDYLPEAVDGYLRLPRDWADTRPIEGGKTALMVLVDQLELLGATMDKMLDAANRADAQALIAHGKFLETKFGPASGGGMLDTSRPGASPLPPPTRRDPADPPTGKPSSGNTLDL